MTGKLLKATHEGVLNIGKISLPVAVLEDGTRIISKSAIFKAFGRTKRGRKKDEIRVLNMPSFIDAKNLQTFINNELEGVLTGVNYINKHNNETSGYKAEILPLLCDMYLSAREKGALTKGQEPLAMASEMLVRSLSKIGILALIDEATGYQEIRDREALQKILDKYLLKEFAAWAKRFPDEFYMLIFKLKGWEWKGMKVNRPSVVGTYTNDLVYDRLAPGLLKELKKLNPKDDRGNRQVKHQQWLTEDIGHPALAQHIHAVMGFMRAASSWDQFYRMMQRAFPKKEETMPLLLED